MKSLQDARRARGLSQRMLAAKAGLSFRGLQHLEEPAHNWRALSLRRVAEALGLPAAGVDLAIGRFVRTRIDSVDDVSIRMVADGFASWKTHLFNFVDAYRSTRDQALVEYPPALELDARLRALLASTVEALCAETGAGSPQWCAGVAGLPLPWFVSGIENLKASALVESPAHFRRRNIFVLAGFLDRA